MPDSLDDLHRLVDDLPGELHSEAVQRLQGRLEDGQEPAGDAGWPGEGLLVLAGSAEGPGGLSASHDERLNAAV